VSTRSADRKVREILEFIRAHPGCGTEDIDVTVAKRSILDSALFQLSLHNLVENREDPDVPPRWYPIEIPVKSVYSSLADDLLESMDNLPQEQRSAYLAKRLEELMG
jgi:DNA-directed RNA polymerase specialized sigma24 family protein